MNFCTSSYQCNVNDVSFLGNVEENLNESNRLLERMENPNDEYNKCYHGGLYRNVRNKFMKKCCELAKSLDQEYNTEFSRLVDSRLIGSRLFDVASDDDGSIVLNNYSKYKDISKYVYWFKISLSCEIKKLENLKKEDAEKLRRVFFESYCMILADMFERFTNKCEELAGEIVECKTEVIKESTIENLVSEDQGTKDTAIEQINCWFHKFYNVLEGLNVLQIGTCGNIVGGPGEGLDTLIYRMKSKRKCNIEQRLISNEERKNYINGEFRNTNLFSNLGHLGIDANSLLDSLNHYVDTERKILERLR